MSRRYSRRKDTQPKLYAIYLRKSRTDKDADVEEVLSKHRNSCFHFAASHNMPVGDVYEEIISGSANLSDRKELQRLLDDCKHENKYKGIIIQALDRLARDYNKQLYLFRVFESLGIKVYSASDNKEIDLTNDPMYKVLAVFGELELENIKTRYKIGREQSILNGSYISTRSPYGYRKTTKIIDGREYKTLEIVPEKAEVVKRIFREKLDNKTLKSIAHGLNEDGILSPTGKFWNTNNVRRVLINEVYMGKTFIGKNVCKFEYDELNNKRIYRETQDEYIIADGKHEAIISEDDFKEVQRIISQTPAVYNGDTVSPFAGLIKCGNCGYSLCRKPTKHRLASGENKKYLNYRHNLFVHDCIHANRQISNKYIIKSLKEAIEDELGSLEMVARAEIKQEDEISKIKKELEAKIKKVNVSIEGMFSELLELIKTNKKDDYTNKLKCMLNESITAEQDRLNKLQFELDNLAPFEIDEVNEKIITLQSVLDILSSNQSGVYGKELNIFLKSIIKRIEVNFDTKPTSIKIVWVDAPDAVDEWKFHRKNEPKKEKK